MIALDTNVLVRFLLQDDPTQARRARRLIEERATVAAPAFITTIVMAELFWLLERSYKIKRTEICRLLDGLLTKAELEFEHTDAVLYAFQIYSTGRGGFTDALLGRVGRASRSLKTNTFDKQAAKLEDFSPA